MSSIVRRTTRGKAKALIDLSNVSNRNKRKQAESDNNSRELNVSAPDSRPARLTASLVIDMSASREQEHGQKQAVVLENVNNKSSQPPTQKKKKKKKMTRKRQTITIKEEEEEEEYKEDFELECEEKFPKKQRDNEHGGRETATATATTLMKEKEVGTTTTASAHGSTATLAEYSYFPFSNEGGRRRTEYRYQLEPYVKYGQLFNPAMRQQTINWMYKRSQRLGMAPETFHLAVRYCDTFLSKRECEQFLQKNGNGSEPLPAKAIEHLVITKGDKTAVGLDAVFENCMRKNSSSYGDDSIRFSAREAEGDSDFVDFGGLTPVFPLGDDIVNQLCNKLKRLGATCLFVAAKIVEVNPPCAGTVAEQTEVSTFNRSQLLLAERALLRELDFMLYRPNPRAFLDAYIDVAHRKVAKISLEERIKESDAKINAKKNNVYKARNASLKTLLEGHKKKVEEFCELTVDLAVLSQQHLRFQPSVLAASALALALEDEWHLSWDSEHMECMVELTGYTFADLAECSKWLLAVLKSAKEAELIQQDGLAGQRWYSKVHANEKYREVIDRVTDPKRPHMKRLEGAFDWPDFEQCPFTVNGVNETTM